MTPTPIPGQTLEGNRSSLPSLVLLFLAQVSLEKHITIYIFQTLLVILNINRIGHLFISFTMCLFLSFNCNENPLLFGVPQFSESYLVQTQIFKS